MRRIAVLTVLAFLAIVGAAGAQPQPARSWAAPQIKEVVDAGLMAPSVADFRPDEPLTSLELATILASLGMEVTETDTDRRVTLRELDAKLVTALGLRPQARDLRLGAAAAGLLPRTWLGTETVARMLGLRVNHLQTEEELELQLSQPATRAEAAYSISRLLTISDYELDAVRVALGRFRSPSYPFGSRTCSAALCAWSAPRMSGREPRRDRSSSSDALFREASTAVASFGAYTSWSPMRERRVSPRF